jgi:uncharacterized membrane protein YagU involved in acid resistance
MMRNAGKGMEDTFTSGFIAGVVSGCITSSLDFILVKLFKFGDLLFIDFAGFVSFNHHPGNFPEYLYALIIQLLFSGDLGWIFYALIKKSPYNQMFKGIIYGITVWFIIYGVLFLYKIDYIINQSFYNSVQNYLIALLFGLILPLIHRRQQKKMKIN